MISRISHFALVIGRRDALLPGVHGPRPSAGAGRRRRRAGGAEAPASGQDQGAHPRAGDRGVRRDRGAGRGRRVDLELRPLDGARPRRRPARLRGARGRRRSGAGGGDGAGRRGAGQRRRPAGAVRLHHARDRRPRSGRGGDRHRGRGTRARPPDQGAARGHAAGAAWAASPAGPRACASGPPQRSLAAAPGAGSGTASSTVRWRAPISPATIAGAARLVERELAGGTPPDGPRDPGRRGPGRSRPADRSRPCARCRRPTSSSPTGWCRAEILDRARRDADRILVGKTPGPAVAEPGRDQRHPDARGRSRPARGPAQGRRPVRVRARRRGDGGTARGRRRRSRWCPASPPPWAAPPRSACR